MEGTARLTEFTAPGAPLASGPPIRAPLAAADWLAATTRYCRGEEVYAPGDPAEHRYRVISGMTRKCAVKADGRRQIVDFLLPGDSFGLTTRHEHHFAVEAVTDGTEVARYPRGRWSVSPTSIPASDDSSARRRSRPSLARRRACSSSGG